MKRTVIYSSLRVYFITLYILIIPEYALSNPIEEVYLRLFLNREGISYIPALVSSEHLYIDLQEYLSALEYPFSSDFDTKIFSTCYPNKNSCIVVENTSVKGDSLSRSYPENMFYWNEEHLYVDIEFLKSLSPFSIKDVLNSLTIHITARSDADIPYLKWAIIRKKYNRHKGVKQQKTDSISSSIFRLNSFGYSVTGHTMRYSNSDPFLSSNSTGMLNGELLGGQFNAQYTHLYNNQLYTPSIYTFNWGYNDINTKLLKQFSLFRTNSNLIMPSPFFTTGVLVSNIPDVGAAFQNYQLKGKTTPNTQVEIYCNGQLVKVIESDDQGKYQTEIPVGGGENRISMIVYDDYGNSYTENQVYFLPPNLESKKKFSYKATGGVTDNKDPYYQVLTSYGLTNRITLSAGTEAVWYHRKELTRLDIFSIKTHLVSFAPFELTYIPSFKWSLNGNLRPLNGFNIYYNYQQYNAYQVFVPNLKESYSVGMSGRVPYIGVSNSFYVSIQSQKYKDFFMVNSSANFNIDYRRYRAGLSVTSNSKDGYKMDYLIFGFRNGYNFTKNFNMETYAEFSNQSKNYRLRARAQYYRSSKYTLFTESFWDSWQQNYNVSFGLYYNFPYFGIRSVATKGKNFFSENINVLGSVNFRKKAKPMLSQTPIIGNNILIIPFLDANGNGKFDRKEKIINKIKISANASGQIVRRRRGINIVNITSNRIFQLKIPKQTLSNISWQIKEKEYSIYMKQYQTHTIYIPIQINSELSGTVKYTSSTKIRRLKINIDGLESDKKYFVYTDEWGDYYFSTLTAGTYRVSLDQEYLEKNNLRLKSKDNVIIEVPIASEGRDIENINFEVENR